MDMLFFDLGESKKRLNGFSNTFTAAYIIFYLTFFLFVILNIFWLRLPMSESLNILILVVNAVFWISQIKSSMIMNRFVKIDTQNISWKTSREYFVRTIHWSAIREIQVSDTSLIFVHPNGKSDGINLDDLHAGQVHDLVQQLKTRATKFGIVMN